MTLNQKRILRSFQYEIIACLFLCALNLIVFWNVQYGGFVYDDALYVAKNTHLTSGLTIDSIKWAFTSIEGGSYHPLTWLSWMADYALYGLHPGGYHWTNLLLHMGNTLLLFLFLRRATGDVFPSAFVAALFAIHPLHVESVAWIAERKDTLSTFFWMLTIGAYLSYAKHPGWRRYLTVTLLFVLGLMAKPMLVTLPFVLLLLDYWPLKRINFSPPQGASMMSQLIWEKMPLILLSIVFSAVTLYTQKEVGALMPIETLPLTSRIMNALVSYTAYIEKMIWPQGLSVFYPYRRIFMPEVLLSVLLLAIISYLAFRRRRSQPYLAVGWLWYLGTLVPVIGLVQVGMQAMADRYTYVPMIGLLIMIAWGGADYFQNRPRGKIMLAACALVVIAGLAAASWAQIAYWQNSTTLFANALRVSPHNHLALGNLGVALKEQGDYHGALEHFREAIRIRPNYATAHDNLGSTYILLGRRAEGTRHLREAFRLDPNHRRIRRNLADALIMEKGYGEAAELYRGLLTTEHDNAELYNNLGVALARLGNAKEAIACFEESLKLRPDYSQARENKVITERLIINTKR
ncbi:MAG: tetratricopeptide repeat protein [Syntrophales bacterium]